ncbi:MAG: SIMPL domain-containing protein, partial [Paracoccaceae bacterium]
MRILTSTFLAAALSLGLAGASVADSTPATITVSGTATVNVVPDLATISLGVTTNGDTAAAAMTANSTALSAVIARLKTAGIGDRDMQTSNLSLNPNWVTNAAGTAQEIKGY